MILQEHAQAMLRRLRDWDHPVVVEVGVASGRLSRQLLQAHPGLHLVMVDSWLPATAQPRRYKDTADCHSVLTVAQQADAKRLAMRVAAQYSRRCSVMAMDSVRAAAQDPNAHMVFLDADHSYEGVLQDIAVWWPCVLVGGWLAGHDYAGHALTPSGERREFGVTRAVDEQCAERGWVLQTDEGNTWFAHKAAL